MSIPTKYNKYWFYFFVMKVFYMFFAVFIFSKITTLGDTYRYLTATQGFEAAIFVNSTKMMDFIGSAFGISIVTSFVGHLFFLSLSFYGVYYAVSKMELQNSQLKILLLFLSLPMYGIWTSVLSKEAIGAFAMGIIAGYIIDSIKTKRLKLKIIEIIALYLIAVFKPQYLIALIHIFSILIIMAKFKEKKFVIFFIFLLILSFDALLFYIFREEINILSLGLYAHFKLDSAKSTRENLWVNDYDVFWNAPYGMFIAFFGPTIQEVINRPVNILAFLESLMIVIIIGWFFLKVFLTNLKTKKFNVLLISVLFFAYFWLLFVHYPFGALNPGSALRYRENFYGFLAILTYFFYIKYFQTKIIKKPYAGNKLS